MIPSVTNNTVALYGLKDDDIRNIIAIIRQQEEVEEAIIFGSRVKGTYKKGSDIDIALKGDEVTHTTISSISFLLNEETQMPYKFDVLNYCTIDNAQLVEHIDRVGICFYKRS